MKPLITCILFVVTLVLYSQDECKITYVSNEGFLIETGGKRILCDALFDKAEVDWCDSPTDSIIELLKNSKEPFDNIDIITVSHKHFDHFNEDVVIAHLKSNSKAILICPQQVGDILAQNKNYQEFNDRIIAITPSLLKDSCISVSDIDIRILRLEHSHYMIKDSLSGSMTNKHSDIENIGFVFTIDERKIFHCGDTNPGNIEEYSTFALAEEEIDIAFLNRIFYSNQETKEVIDTHINPTNIILMHINPANQAQFASHFKQLPNIHVFENKMESIKIQ